MPSEGQSMQGSADSASRRNRNSLICRDLDDIYLLLDHLSGRADKNVSNLTIDIDGDPVTVGSPGPLAAPTARPVTKRNLVQSVCEVEGWPPTSQTRYSAGAATTLFKARDVLNEISWPASGMTIAYTIMVTDGLSRKWKWPRRQRAPSDQPKPVGEGGASEAGKPSDPALQQHATSTSADDGSAARTNLAISAYPHLVGSARRLRSWITVYIAMLVVALGFTALLSWNVASGKLIIERLNDLKIRETVQSARLLSAEGNSGAILQNIGTSSEDVPDAGYTFDTSCTPDGKAQPTPGANLASPAQAPDHTPVMRLDSLCGKGFAILDQRFASDYTLEEWFGPWKRISSMSWTLGPETIEPKDQSLNIRTRIRNAAILEQQAGDTNTVLASYVLPMLYGLLGAATAVIRGINSKMRESTLAPRDLRVTQVQLSLGILVGACIGLFVSPTGTPDVRLPNVTLAGNGVSLSASALSFIAGFGVEAVFKWLEVIIAIAFAAGGAAANQTAPPPPRQTARQA